MNRNFPRSLGVLALAAAAGAAQAQIGNNVYDPTCWPPMAAGFSDDYIAYVLPQAALSNNPLFGVTLGIAGTDTYGSIDNVPICDVAGTFNAPGRLGFTIGSIGSVQSTTDEFRRLTFGMPFMVGANFGYAVLAERQDDGTVDQQLIGSASATTAFVGASDRYALGFFTEGDYQIRIQTDLIGDSARVSWAIQNNADAIRNVGLWFGSWVTFLDQDQNAVGGGSSANYVTAPGFKPFRVGTRFQRVVTGSPRPGVEPTPQQLPNYFSFGHTQEDAYGLQVVCSSSTDGSLPVDQTNVDEFVVGQSAFLLGIPLGSNATEMPDVMFPDAFFTDYNRPDLFDDTGFIMKFNPQPVAAGATREIVSYFRSTWSNANYARPFTAVVDAPQVIATQSTENPNVLTPNPATVRVYVDNTRGYSSIDREIPLDNVQIKLTLPPGITDAADSTRNVITRFLNRVEARQLTFADFNIRVSPEVFGLQPYNVEITTQTGVRKIITGNINVAATPRLRFPSTANLVGSPWTYGNTSWETILQNLRGGEPVQVDRDFRAFTWDALQQEYVIQTGPERGRGTWILTEPTGTIVLGGNPSEPTDTTAPSGAPLTTIRPGWNLIANPYNYSFELGQIVGVSTAAPEQSYTFAELVAQQILSPAIAFYDADAPTPDYKFLQTVNDLVLPNRGYWIFNQTAQDVVLSFPRVFTPFLPERNAAKLPAWKLQLVARNEKSVDSQNYVGVVSGAAAVTRNSLLEPPQTPLDDVVGLSIEDTDAAGKTRAYAQAVTDGMKAKTWNVKVTAKGAGPVTLTWPNLKDVPSNVQFRITDTATGATRSLRRTSGYTFQAAERSSRTFTLSMEPGSVARALIGAVTVGRASRSANAPLTISYSLAGDATTSVRILQGGREVFVASRSRADAAGLNSVVWNLRDSANRNVAPGAYTVEITAETENGERVRRFVPVNVVR